MNLISLLLLNLGGKFLSKLIEGDSDGKLDPSTKVLVQDVTGIVFDKIGDFIKWLGDQDENPKDDRDACVANRDAGCSFSPRKACGLCALHVSRDPADVGFKEYTTCQFLQKTKSG